MSGSSDHKPVGNMGNSREQPGDGVDVEKIMEDIRRRVKYRSVVALLEKLSQNSSIMNGSYAITSHRKVTGPILVKGRSIVNGETRRYVDPSLEKQTRFNQGMVEILENLISRLDRAEDSYEDALSRQDELTERLERVERLLGKDQPSAWDEFYDIDVNEKFLGDNVEFHKEFLALVEEYSKKSAGGRVPKLLEVGLGTATFSIHFSRNAYECIGIDNEPFIIKKAAQTNKQLGGYARFMLIDALDMGILKDGYFDVAFSQGTLEHFDNATLFELLARQLAVARYVVFSVPSKFWPAREFGNERKIDVDGWRLLLESAGFSVLYIGYYHDKTQVACVVGPA